MTVLLPRRAEVATYRVRADIARARPPVWRRLDIASDLTLDVLHEVLQAAFGWTDSHLHRFSVGGDAYDRGARAFATAFDIAQGDGGGTPEADVRLDEVLGSPGDVLHYLYDFGDDWHHVIALEAVLPREAGAPPVSVVTGRLAGPREDVGWSEEPPEGPPEPVDLEAVRQAVARVVRGPQDWTQDLDDDVVASAVRPWTRLLELVGPDGLTLTAAGYLPPRIVQELFAAVDPDQNWIGKGNREDLTPPVAALRENARALRLLRSAKGRLLLTATGRALVSSPRSLLQHVVAALPLGRPQVERDAGTVCLRAVAEARTPEDEPAALVAGMQALGWSTAGGPVEASDVLRAAWPTLDALHTLGALQRPRRPDGRPDYRAGWFVTPQGRVIARAALARAPVPGAALPGDPRRLHSA